MNEQINKKEMSKTKYDLCSLTSSHRLKQMQMHLLHGWCRVRVVPCIWLYAFGPRAKQLMVRDESCRLDVANNRANAHFGRGIKKAEGRSGTGTNRGFGSSSHPRPPVKSP